MATTDQSIRSYLDSLGQLPGSILYRNTIAWEALPPGQAGQLLTLDAAGLPAWTDRGSYFPALMRYNGTSTQYSRTGLTLTGNTLTIPLRFTHAPVTGTHCALFIANSTIIHTAIKLFTDRRLRIECFDNAWNPILRARTSFPVDDEQLRYAWFKYNATTGAFEFKIDGQDADDTTWGPRIVTTGTLPTGAGSTINAGEQPSTSQFWNGTIGAVGFKQSDTPNWQDFMDANGWPLPIDHDTWTQWVGQPPVWHESGGLQWNRGTAGPFTASGNPTLADPLDWN